MEASAISSSTERPLNPCSAASVSAAPGIESAHATSWNESNASAFCGVVAADHAAADDADFMRPPASASARSSERRAASSAEPSASSCSTSNQSTRLRPRPALPARSRRHRRRQDRRSARRALRKSLTCTSGARPACARAARPGRPRPTRPSRGPARGRAAARAACRGSVRPSSSGLSSPSWLWKPSSRPCWRRRPRRVRADRPSLPPPRRFRRRDPRQDEATGTERPRPRPRAGAASIERVERDMASCGVEAASSRAAPDLSGVVAVEVEELDALVAHSCDGTKSALEVAGALLPDRVEHQAEACHYTAAFRCPAMKSRYQSKLAFGTRSSVG